MEKAREPGTGLNQVCIGVVSTKSVIYLYCHPPAR